jgi:hypothetical protein
VHNVYDDAGGDERLLRLAEAWHARAMADEVVSHDFSHGFHPRHSERLAAYCAEALGGPHTYSERYGGDEDDGHVWVEERMEPSELECALVGGAGFFGTPQAAQKVGAGGVQILVVVQGKAVDDSERSVRPLDLGEGDRPIELDHRRTGQAGELG